MNVIVLIQPGGKKIRHPFRGYFSGFSQPAFQFLHIGGLLFLRADSALQHPLHPFCLFCKDVFPNYMGGRCIRQEAARAELLQFLNKWRRFPYYSKY